MGGGMFKFNFNLFRGLNQYMICFQVVGEYRNDTKLSGAFHSWIGKAFFSLDYFKNYFTS